MKKLIAALPALVLCAHFASAHEGNEHIMNMPKAMPKEFDQMRNLIGTWEGTADMGDGKEQPVTAVYELTSGGTAITEKLMPGTTHEMTTIFYKDGKSVAMTHYCAMGNHPEMKLKSADGKAMTFEMKGAAGIASAKEEHMHALTITTPDANTLQEEWTNFADGKKKMTAKFKYKRKI